MRVICIGQVQVMEDWRTQFEAERHEWWERFEAERREARDRLRKMEEFQESDRREAQEHFRKWEELQEAERRETHERLRKLEELQWENQLAITRSNSLFAAFMEEQRIGLAELREIVRLFEVRRMASTSKVERGDSRRPIN